MKQSKSISQSGSNRRAENATLAGRADGTGWKSILERLFSIDPRSLALFRMAVGTILLADLAIRFGDLNVMYTDNGMFPRAEICRLATTVWNWSFHFGSGSSTFQAMLFGIAAILAIGLLVGYETRIAVIGSWLMLISIHHRVPAILSGAEILLGLLLFWAMFLPLNRAWSVDCWLAKRRGSAVTACSIAPVLSIASSSILLQMALMYLFSAIFKSNSVWLRGEAIGGILLHDFYASPSSTYLLQFPRLLTGMTWATFFLEWAAPILLFIPARTSQLRLWLLPGLAIMHAAIGAFLEVGLFSYVSLAGLTLFLPASFWNSRLFNFFAQSSRTVPLDSEGGKQIARPSTPYAHIAQGACAVLLFYVVLVNVNSFPSQPLSPMSPERWRPLARGLSLGQMWGMFGAVPSKDGWYVARAKLKDGSEVDLLRQGALLSWSKPEFPARLYPNHYWQKLFREMAYDDEQGFQLLREPVAKYLCRNWNAQNSPEKQIADFEFIYCMIDDTAPKGQLPPRVFREPLFRLDLTTFYN